MMQDTTGGNVPKVKSERVTIRLTPADRARLNLAATQVYLTPAALAAVFIDFGLSELARNNPELDRAIKVSRDSPVKQPEPIRLTPGSKARMHGLVRTSRG
jgi:hypothetical protein